MKDVFDYINDNDGLNDELFNEAMGNDVEEDYNEKIKILLDIKHKV